MLPTKSSQNILTNIKKKRLLRIICTSLNPPYTHKKKANIQLVDMLNQSVVYNIFYIYFTDFILY